MGGQSQHEWGLNPTGMGHWPRPQVEMFTEGLGASKTGGVSLLKITWAWTRNTDVMKMEGPESLPQMSLSV